MNTGVNTQGLQKSERVLNMSPEIHLCLKLDEPNKSSFQPRLPPPLSVTAVLSPTSAVGWRYHPARLAAHQRLERWPKIWPGHALRPTITRRSGWPTDCIG